MSPEEKDGSAGANGEEPRDETQEFELGDDATDEEDLDEGGAHEEEADEEAADDEPASVFDGHEHLEGDSEEFEAQDEPDEDDEPDEPETGTPKDVGAPATDAAEEASPEDVGGGEDAPSDEEDAPPDEDDDDSELDQLTSAETAEWDGLEAAEAEDETPEDAPLDDEPTLVASAGQRLGEARSKITSGFEKVKGSDKVGAGLTKVKGWRPGFPLWLRFLTASMVIVFSVAAAVSASLILYLGDIADALHDPTGQLEGADKFLTTVDGGGPQTILILGSDKDPELKDVQKGFRGLSDTTMLLRLDPHRDAIALFSLPRDLQVTIPGYGTNKLNAAYSFGGPQLTLRTVEELLTQTGQPFQVNHLVNVDFEGFARAVNEIDCVYVDVDRRYFHSNDNTGAAEDYEEIDLQPGYQALCGFDALDYARYRHTDNDIIRAARQQEFLREARAKVPPERLIDDRKDLISIFTEHTTSDINNPQTMLQVLKLLLDARDAPIKEVHFEGELGPSFVTTTTQELRRAVNQFLGIEASGQGGQSAVPDEPVAPEAAPDQVDPATPAAPADKAKKQKARAKKRAQEPPPSTGGSVDNNVSLTSVASFSKQLAAGVRARRAPGLPVFYPTQLEAGSDFAQKPRVYKVNGTGVGAPPRGERAAYKYVFSRPALGEYYGFMATSWRDPPILEDPDTERTIGDRDYKIFLDGDRVRMVAWQDDNGSYWLSNTLIESLSNEEMLEIAKSIKELPSG